MIRDKLHIGMSLAPTWLSGQGWRRADSNVEGLFGTDFYVDIAKRAEAAKCDFVFRPDSLFLNTAALESGGGFASLDPTILLAAIARETENIGLLSTVSTTFYPPFIVARQILSLHWISNGRAGWNIVTALDGNENFGFKSMPSPEERYARAAECTEVVRLLWQSFPIEAILFDKNSGRYGDAGLAQPINHVGDFFSVKGPLNLPDQGSPIPLAQAGASPSGRDFASAVADVVFASTPDMDAAIDMRTDLRRRAAGHGRSPDAIRLMPGLSLYLADSRSEARDLFLDTHAKADNARKLALIRDMTGLDLSDWPTDRPVTGDDLPERPEMVRSRTHSDLLRRLIIREAPTVAELLQRPEVVASAHWQVIGTVDDAVDAVQTWRDAGAIDGFIALPGGSVSSMHLALEGLLPTLASLGLFREGYESKTFAGHFQYIA